MPGPVKRGLAGNIEAEIFLSPMGAPTQCTNAARGEVKGKRALAITDDHHSYDSITIHLPVGSAESRPETNISSPNTNASGAVGVQCLPG